MTAKLNLISHVIKFYPIRWKAKVPDGYRTNQLLSLLSE